MLERSDIVVQVGLGGAAGLVVWAMLACRLAACVVAGSSRWLVPCKQQVLPSLSLSHVSPPTHSSFINQPSIHCAHNHTFTYIQVVDARDPLTYFSHDLVSLAHELHPTKSSFVLLNKADLLPAAVREAWADYFDARGIQYGFWSAFAASEAQARARHDATALGLVGYTSESVLSHFWDVLGMSKQQQQQQGGAGGSSSSRTRILPVEELLELLEGMARAAVDAADPDDTRRWVCVVCVSVSVCCLMVCGSALVVAGEVA